MRNKRYVVQNSVQGEAYAGVTRRVRKRSFPWNFVKLRLVTKTQASTGCIRILSSRILATAWGPWGGGL